MAISTSERREISLLFDGAEFIPPEILSAVKKTLFAAKKKHSLNHETFKDLIQTCLMKIWALERKFESESPAYFGCLVKNTVIDYCRERAKLSRLAVAPDEDFFTVGETEMMNDALHQIHSKRDLDDLIQAVLDDEEAAVIILSFFEGLSLYQISIHLEISVSTVKRRRFDAVQKLRSGLRPAVFQTKGLA